VAGTWTDLTSAHYGSGRRISSPLWTALANNQDAATEHVFQMQHTDRIDSSPTYPTFGTILSIDVLVPQSAQVFRWTLEALRQSGAGTCYLRMRVLGGAIGPEVTVTEASATEKTVSISGLAALRGTVVTLELQVSTTGVTTVIETLCVAMVTARWSYD